jgi:hypothetical protein
VADTTVTAESLLKSFNIFSLGRNPVATDTVENILFLFPTEKRLSDRDSFFK